MSYIDIILLAFALSVDACVVSFSYGLKICSKRLKNALLLGIVTGLFQGLMPVVGYFLTGFVKSYVQPYSRLITFTIFVYLGIKFIIESKQEIKETCIDFKCLMLLGIATSIDAFSAGISLSVMGNHILKPAILIAVITFIDSLFGFFAGGKLKHLPEKTLQIIAGLTLIGLGIKSLF